jgi:hypothetical protein
MRIKNQWFNSAKAKTPQETAGAMAFITWRVGQNMLKQMRTADFDIDIGKHYFTFTREVLAFLMHVLDRMAHARMAADERTEFTTALVLRMADILQENEDIHLGERATEIASYRDEFIALFNESGAEYADFTCDANGPEFAFVRYFGHRVEALMPEKDRPWVVDQLMAIEVPEALQTLQRGMDGVLSTEQRAARRGHALAGGD